MDSMDTVYYRPESNADYVMGMMLGFAKTFMTMAGVSLVIGMLLHIFASESPFNFWIYPFYWLTMIFPALVFALGFSFFIHTWLRHRGLSILILLVVFGIGGNHCDFSHCAFGHFASSFPSASRDFPLMSRKRRPPWAVNWISCTAVVKSSLRSSSLIDCVRIFSFSLCI